MIDVAPSEHKKDHGAPASVARAKSPQVARVVD